MPLRRSHTKSHHGCSQCKQRRIKCDESRPSCGSCRRKRIVCTYQSHAPWPTSPSQECQTLTGGTASGVRETATLPFLELELLHHWHSITAPSLAHSKSVQDLFCITVPRLALRHPFLMHSVLAVSALQISYTCAPERRQMFMETAISHNDLSLSMCTPLLSSMTSDNCDALFAFSCLVAIFGFAAQGPAAIPSPQGVADVVKVFKLVRGAASIVAQAKTWLRDGEMRLLLRVGRYRGETLKTKYVLELCTLLREVVEQQASAESHLLDRGRDSPLLGASKHLLHKLYMTLEDPSAILTWPALIDAEYLDLLLRKDPSSFVPLAYYGVALELFVDVWWLDGWGDYLVKLAIERLGYIDNLTRCIDVLEKDRRERTMLQKTS
ncbi:hypothetical protein BDV25DRAFT_171890 [Aspergillus avenaceus]|uniref:Zn(2)-C6 fungal-type domain-containing protein n=1 Tax=Aspergillus avenaceus TaxID=36643 RepID=A0A5N6TX39_ASPAV|nr:hypothetical protein BDV25DRAFT_171890 [Aspergillus avenaceus]